MVKDPKKKKQYIHSRGMNKTGHWSQNKENTSLSAGLRGFLITCDTNRDDLCTREALNMLDEFVQQMYPTEYLELSEEVNAKEAEKKAAAAAAAAAAGGEGGAAAAAAPPPAPAPSSNSIEEELERERKALQLTARRLFAVVKTNLRGLVFIRVKVDWVDIVQVVENIVAKAVQTKSINSRYCSRVLPVEKSCFCSVEAVVKAITPLIERWFPADGDAKTYAIVYRSRGNNSLHRMEVITAVADIVPKNHTVDLENADVSIIIEVMKNAAMLSISSRFNELMKFNILVASETEEQRNFRLEKQEKAQAHAASFKANGDNEDDGEKAEEDDKGEEKEEDGDKKRKEPEGKATEETSPNKAAKEE